tara:strand:- start:466 stop:669 length:204 start_codon:yes stop_codon:yes gene_type:complete
MKKVTIAASYSSDLDLALRWLKLNKALKATGPVKKVGNIYTVTVKSRSKEQVEKLIKDRFGIFIKVL